MQETTILFIMGLTFAFIAVMYALHLIYTKVLSDKYLKESRKLQLLLNNLKNQYGELVNEPSEFVGQAISNMGIEALLSQFGIDPSILNNPLIKGFLDKYLKKGGEGGQEGKNQYAQV